MQDHFLRFWQQVARKFSGNPHVLGIPLTNIHIILSVVRIYFYGREVEYVHMARNYREFHGIATLSMKVFSANMHAKMVG